jgi:hypothetical protein
MKKIVSVRATWMCSVAALLLLASESRSFAKSQKKLATSGREKPEAILSAAKKFADAKA